MAGRVFEVLLDRIELEESGSAKKDGQHLLIASLIWPRPRIAERDATEALQFVGNVADMKKLAWADRVVFKEVVDGPFALRFGITERVSNSQVAGFVRHLGSGVMKLAGNEIEDIIPNSLIGSVVKLPLQYLSKAIMDSGKKGPKIIASGVVDLDSEQTWKKSRTKAFKVRLTAPEAIEKTVRGRRDGKMSTRKKTVLRAGAENGVVMFTGKVWG